MQRMGWTLAVVALLASMGSVAASLWALGRMGVAARRIPTGKTLMLEAATGAEAVVALEQANVHGALLVQAGPMSTVEPETLVGQLPQEASAYAEPFPVVFSDAPRWIRRTLGPQTYPFGATRLGVARRLVQVLTPTAFDAYSGGAANGPGGAPVCARVNDAGEVHFICRALPPTPDPVVLLLNAAWFVDSTGRELADAVLKSNPRLAVLALSLDADDPRVTDGARQAARTFVAAVIAAEGP